jgi:hypothetical protein
VKVDSGPFELDTPSGSETPIILRAEPNETFLRRTIVLGI